MEDGAIVILCTAPAQDDTAQRLARGLVESGLVACVNVIGPIRSVYRWQGNVEDDQELQLLIKTRASAFGAVERFVKEHHPYEVPELLALPVVAGSDAYLSWLRDQTRES
jgi:periplasmic divalent cation tolerance protein